MRRWLAPLAALLMAAGAAAAPDTRLDVDTAHPGPVLSRMVFGQFAEQLGRGINDGIWVGPASPIANDAGYRRDVLAALRAINVPLVRWPGGCFADGYDWRDGIGPSATRPRRVNASWGGTIDDNSFGTHEFMGLVERLGAEAYLALNIGSAPPRDSADWLDYMTAPTGTTRGDARAANGRAAPWRIAYVGIGNELWGCGGAMRADYAADVTNRYASFARTHGTPAQRIASGPNEDDYGWTETLMKHAANQFDGLSLHYYTVPGGWADKAPALGFDAAGWAETLARTRRMDALIAGHSAIMDKYDPARRKWLAVDEWGTWYAPPAGAPVSALYQQNSLRDAMVAAVNINIFAQHAARVRMAVIAQMVNVLQAMLLTDGPRMVRTPSYWVFDLYRPWHDAIVLPIKLTTPDYVEGRWTMPAVSASVVRDRAGTLHVALANLDPHRPHDVAVALPGMAVHQLAARILTAAAMDAHNSFDAPDRVRPARFDGARATADGLALTLPAKSIVVIAINGPAA